MSVYLFKMSVMKLRFINSKYIRFFCSERPTILRGISPFWMRKAENLMINRLLDANNEIDDNKWITIRKELLDSQLPINNQNVDSAIVDRCNASGNILAAMSYINFLKATNHELNIATVGKYFKSLYSLKKSLDPEETEEVYKLYDDIRAKHSILDSQTAENCILILSMTKRWKECSELLKMVEFSGSSRSIAYNAITRAAFNNDEPEIGWKNLKIMRPRLDPDIGVFESFINYSIRNSKNSKDLKIFMDRMFKIWSDCDIYPDSDVINMFMKCLKNSGEWIVNTARINSNGTCSACGSQLTNARLSTKDFNHLSKEFLNKVLVSNDVYKNTTPAELEYFKNFVESTKPYDVVIDGLNAAYSLQNYKNAKQKHNYGHSLANVVAGFVQQNKKIFVLGRQHMKKWSAREMEYIKRHSHIFLANDLSEDDPFLLYAAFTSGINTYLSSRDFMRQHKFILSDDNLRRIFRHWQLTRQIIPTYPGTSQNKQLLLIYPPTFLPIAQKNSNNDWHIPYKKTGSTKELQPSHRWESWLCIRQKN